jgi:hypothetical protein
VGSGVVVAVPEADGDGAEATSTGEVGGGVDVELGDATWLDGGIAAIGAGVDVAGENVGVVVAGAAVGVGLDVTAGLGAEATVAAGVDAITGALAAGTGFVATAVL